MYIVCKSRYVVSQSLVVEVRIINKIKVGFFQKVLAKFSNFSKCHSREPKIVPELLIHVNDNIEILVIL